MIIRIDENLFIFTVVDVDGVNVPFGNFGCTVEILFEWVELFGIGVCE